MAEVIEEYQFQPARNAAYYPWAEWFDGRIWRLTQGQDYRSKLSSFRNHVYGEAKKRGIKVHFAQDSDTTVVIQAYKADT